MTLSDSPRPRPLFLSSYSHLVFAGLLWLAHCTRCRTYRCKDHFFQRVRAQSRGAFWRLHCFTVSARAALSAQANHCSNERHATKTATQVSRQVAQEARRSPAKEAGPRQRRRNSHHRPLKNAATLAPTTRSASSACRQRQHRPARRRRRRRAGASTPRPARAARPASLL